MVRLDDLDLKNVYLIKIDVEGMEEASLVGARRLLERDKPVLCMEWIKADKLKLIGFCKELGYRVYDLGTDLLCVHREKAHAYAMNIAVPEL